MSHTAIALGKLHAFLRNQGQLGAMVGGIAGGRGSLLYDKSFMFSARWGAFLTMAYFLAVGQKRGIRNSRAIFKKRMIFLGCAW